MLFTEDLSYKNDFASVTLRALNMTVYWFNWTVLSFIMFLFVLFQPSKTLGIYTFTKRVFLEDFENKPRKQQGYSTVSHFNIVHYDCHLAAVR